MRTPLYRYFLGFRPDPLLCQWLASLGRATGQEVRAGLLHLTLCVLAEIGARDPFILPRVRAALDGRALHSFPIRLGRVKGGRHGAAVQTLGRQGEIQDFYRTLVRWLVGRELAPLHRKSGLHPHLTLGYDACDFAAFKILTQWFPRELLLIESEVGHGRHNVLGRWPLLPSRQGELGFGGEAPRLRRAG